jgi:hypothetical protein
MGFYTYYSAYLAYSKKPFVVRNVHIYAFYGYLQYKKAFMPHYCPFV